ncbi:MAG: hydrogenase-4 component E [Proteobacteria bacterium]|nr:hydrogenase-4 component E [Pseudomonadota bacterium]MBI3496419.1 hydrogenase-4 component E [Pseudomonadota bacterium]
MPAAANHFYYDVAHLLGALVLLCSFVLIYQRRLTGIINAFTMQSLALALAAAWQAFVQDAPHLFVTAGIALLFKTVTVPVALHWIVRRLAIHETVENALGIGLSLLSGVGLVALAVLLVLPVTGSTAALTRETLAMALSILLLGLLIMIARRNAIAQVVGFMSLENGLVLAAVGVKGMPLVVEMSVAFSLLVAFILFGLFFFRIRERFDTLDLQFVESFRGERR